MKIKSTIEFSGVPKGTTGEAIRDGDLWKITWHNIERMGTLPSGRFGKKLLEDWFDQYEFKKYLVVVN